MSYQMPIEAGKIAEFARATQSSNSAYLGADPISPATFLTTSQFWASPDQSKLRKLGFDLKRVLHAEEEYVFPAGPVRAGQTLTVTSRLEKTFEKLGRRGGVMRFGVVVNEFRDQADRLVAEQRTTIVETSKPPAEDAS
jgi:hydroxyacyl-ACP dehydratase HTD2-like protein with hotdog domain